MGVSWVTEGLPRRESGLFYLSIRLAPLLKSEYIANRTKVKLRELRAPGGVGKVCSSRRIERATGSKRSHAAEGREAAVHGDYRAGYERRVVADQPQ